VLEKAQAKIRQALKGKKKIYEKDLQNLSYLTSVIKETLRLHPAGALLLPRECGEPCEIDGYKIPIKTKVIINAWAIGRRMCPGVLFGLANIELPLAQLLYQFDWKLLGMMKPEDLDMVEDFGAVVRRKNNLCLIPTSFSQSSPAL
jgi:cytochrome P450